MVVVAVAVASPALLPDQGRSSQALSGWVLQAAEAAEAATERAEAAERELDLLFAKHEKLKREHAQTCDSSQAEVMSGARQLDELQAELEEANDRCVCSSFYKT